MNALQSHRFLMRVALAAVNLFAWIFIFQYFFARSNALSHALLQTIVVYALVHFVIFFMTPFSARHLRNGIIRPMTEGVVLAAGSFSVLALAFKGYFGAYIVVGILLYAVLRGMYHALYWVPYTMDSLQTGQRKSITRFLQEGTLALIPTIAGLILTSGVGGLSIVFYSASILAIASLVPLRYIKEIHEGYSWGFVESFHKLFARRNRTLTTTAFLDGISGAALLLFWPIAIFLLVGWSYAMLGLIMSITYLLVFFIRAHVRDALKKVRAESSILVHVFLTVSGWLLRLVVATPIGVVLVDSYFYTGSQVRGTGISTLTFDQSADRGSYIDEYTTLKEMALALGKITTCVVGAFFAATVSFPVTLIAVFLLAAAASGASVFLSRKSTHLF